MQGLDLNKRAKSKPWQSG